MLLFKHCCHNKKFVTVMRTKVHDTYILSYIVYKILSYIHYSGLQYTIYSVKSHSTVFHSSTSAVCQRFLIFLVIK